MKKKNNIVIDTNVIVSALRSNAGASFILLSLIDSEKFKINISVPLILEYESNAKKRTKLDAAVIEDIIDYICKIGRKRKTFYLWRPFLRDPKDDFILELAVESQSQYIITYNKKDFKGCHQFGITVLDPKEYLTKIGELQ